MKVGDLVGHRYRIEAVIGRGGVATVYRVRHEELDTQLALKVLHAGSRTVRQRLMREGKAQAGMKHDNVVTVTDLIEVDGDAGLVMEYISGPSLDRWLMANEPDLPQALRLFEAVVRGVAYAHDEGLIHRDLKPANILLARGDEGYVPKVCDFGLVKLIEGHAGAMSGRTRTGMAMGTPGYMAPEQVRDASKVDHRADLFSLGCILYELVTGARPFAGQELLDILNAVVRGNYTPPEELVPTLPRPLRQLITDMLQVDPDDRIESADEILERLESQDMLTPAQPSTLERWLGPTVGRVSLGGVALGAVVVLGIAGTSAAVALQRPLPDPKAVEIPDVRLAVEAAQADGRRPILMRELLPGKAPPPDEDEEEPLPPWNGPSDPEAAALALSDEPDLPPDPRGLVDNSVQPDAERVGIELTGDATEVWLVAGRFQYPAHSDVPPGRYTIHARFDGPEWIAAGRVRIREDSEVSLHCDSVSLTCR